MALLTSLRALKTPSARVTTPTHPAELTRRKAFQAACLITSTGLLGACAAGAGTPSATGAATALSTATTLWGIAKGVGQVALDVLSVVNPPAAAIVNGAIALIDPLLAAGTADAALVTTQAHAVLLAAAPVVTVITTAAHTATQAAVEVPFGVGPLPLHHVAYVRPSHT
jgi:hypothetical protein